MSSQFEFLSNGWLKHGDLFNFTAPIRFSVDLDPSFFEQLEFDQSTLLQYRIDAANEAASFLGNNPVLCLSGGVDSQAMIQAWQEAGLKFDVAVMKFSNDLNNQDVDHAKLYCNTNNIPIKEIEFDVVNFLTRESIEQGEKYRCTSPHFITHYKFFDILREMGYTGICCGGTAFAPGKDGWGPAPSIAQINYLEYSKLNEFPVFGNFLGYDAKLCWSIALLTPPHAASWHKESIDFANDTRYLSKVEGYQRHGLNIIPQSQKYTGFEKVKDYFASKTGDGWTFEKRFRHPLEKKIGITHTVLELTEMQKEVLFRVYLKNFPSSIAASSGISI